MAVKTIEVRDVGESGDRLDVWHRPKFIAFDDVGASDDWLAIGDVAVVGIMLDGIPDDDDALTLRRIAFLDLVDGEDVGGDTLSIPADVSPQVTIEVVDVGESDDALALLRVTQVVISDVGASDDRLMIGDADLPVVPGGVVNVIPNPSVEVDLSGWVTTDATIARVVGNAWVGDAMAAGDIETDAEAGATYPILTIETLPAIGANAAPESVWIGAVMLSGDAVVAEVILRIIYDDASTQDTASTIDHDPLEPITLTDDWTSFATDAAVVDAAKRVDRMQIRIGFARQTGETTYAADGAIIADITETGGLPTYVDGDQGDGFHWVGVAHASPSYREAGA